MTDDPEPSDAYSPFPRSVVNSELSPSSSSSAKLEESPTASLQPFSSVRRCRSITLANGMKVLLVQDKRAASASAALTIQGAGQFADPTYLNGLAHLMEHITLSSAARLPRRGDFEEWVNSDYAEGYSNGFTAYEKVCFHFQCRTDVFAEALERFARLFLQDVVQRSCRDRENLRREIRRITAELDTGDLFTRELYLTKSLINPDHPYARFTMGNAETLDRLPTEANINVSEKLFDFFKERYQPSRAILVVISASPLSSLETWVAPFASTLSKVVQEPRNDDMGRAGPAPSQQRAFPEFFTSPRNPFNTLCLFRRKPSHEVLADCYEKLSFQWPLSLDYSDLLRSSDTTAPSNRNNVVTATQIGFVMSQLLGRRGPGSLYTLLKNRKWVPDGIQGVPRISFPVDVSGFQIIRLELTLTLEGFVNRAAVIAAVYDSLNVLTAAGQLLLSRELISQYCAVGIIYGHLLSPRPPDAIELAFDGQIYGVDGPAGIATPNWRLLPLPQDTAGVRKIQSALQAALGEITDPSNAIIIATASQKALQYAQGKNVFDEPFPLFSPASWEISPITGARYYRENNTFGRLTGKVNEWVGARLALEDELLPPALNPLIPPVLRPPRVLDMLGGATTANVVLREADDESDPILSRRNVRLFASALESDDPIQSSIMRDYWALLKVFAHDNGPPGLGLPRVPPEPSPRSVFILQFLSSRPPRANSRMAAHAEVWKASLEYALADLAELGAPAGLAYEISFNKFGMRVAFLGLSQNIASYARRLSRRIVDHQSNLLEGPERFPAAVTEASLRSINRFRMSPQRKTILTNLVRETRSADAAVEGTGLFQSCSGAVCTAQGDLLPSEALALLADLKKIFRKVTGANVSPPPAVPDAEDLFYRANWIPRSASSCTVPGASLISNPCGRVPR